MQYPTMTECINYGPTYARDISQDDLNGFHVARPRYPIITANDSFEYTTPIYGFIFTPRNGGAWARYCDGTGANGSCFVQFNGVDSSIYQDVISQGASATRSL
jgi:hypothetical protein